MFASLPDAPAEILQRIILFAVSDSLVGPPRELAPFSLLCRTSYRALALHSPNLYASIFSQKFDSQIPAHHLGNSVVHVNARAELQKRFTVLKCFKQDRWEDLSLNEALWTVYLMLTSADSGQKNIKQLSWAGLPKFIDSYVRGALRADANKKWPVGDETMSLALAVYWLLSTRASVTCESLNSLEEIRSLLGPYVYAANRYPISPIPEYMFDLDKKSLLARSTQAQHSGKNPVVSYPPAREVSFFGNIRHSIDIPSLPLYATLIYLTRLEALPPQLPSHIKNSREKNEGGPTAEDLFEFTQSCVTHYSQFPSNPRTPWPTLNGTRYKLGDLTGSWRGSWVITYMDEPNWLLQSDPPPPKAGTQWISRTPLFVTLQEHYCCNPLSVVPADKAENGAKNAWVPEGWQFAEVTDGMEFYDEEHRSRRQYQTYRPGKTPEIDYDRVSDVIITGKVDKQHAAAWGQFVVLGRVRLADGMVMISRDSSAGLGRSLLKGYRKSIIVSGTGFGYEILPAPIDISDISSQLGGETRGTVNVPSCIFVGGSFYPEQGFRGRDLLPSDEGMILGLEVM